MRIFFGRASVTFRIALLATLVSCGGAGELGTIGIEGCLVGVPSGNRERGAVETGASERPIVIGVADPVDLSNAPLPTNAAERLAFAQMYETLVRVDCTGRVVPGLAESWRTEDGGRRWIFTVRANARDWVGEPVIGAHVLASLTGVSPITGIALPGRLTVDIELRGPFPASVFARPEFAIRTRGPDGRQIGTGPFRPGGRGAGGQPSSSTVALDGPTPLEFRRFTGDPRDALDRGVDVLVTAEPTAIEYARSTPRLEAFPMAWDRRYTLVSRGAVSRVGDANPGVPAILRPPVSALSLLATGAVRQEARGASAPREGWLCPPPRLPGMRSSLSAAPAPSRRIVYRSADPVARALAERLAALASSPVGSGRWVLDVLPAPGLNGAPLRAVGLGDGPYRAALQVGADAAYVVSTEGAGEPTCSETSEILFLAPWLGTSVSPGQRGPGVAFLVETRNTLVLGADIGGMEIDGRGGFRLGQGFRATGERP